MKEGHFQRNHYSVLNSNQSSQKMIIDSDYLLLSQIPNMQLQKFIAFDKIYFIKAIHHNRKPASTFQII